MVAGNLKGQLSTGGSIPPPAAGHGGNWIDPSLPVTVYTPTQAVMTQARDSLTFRQSDTFAQGRILNNNENRVVGICPQFW